MAEVNEEIIEQYLKIVKKWFYVTDISFVVPNNYSNIDILAYNPKENKYYDIEVKYRSEYVLSEKNRNKEDISKDSVKFLAEQFLKYSSRTKKIKEYTNNIKAENILVTTKQLFGKSKRKRNNMENALINYMKEKKCKLNIWYFDDIIPELFKHIEVKGRYNTQLLQTIRMIKTYLPVQNNFS